MTNLYLDILRMPAAELGRPNPLPPYALEMNAPSDIPLADKTDYPDRGKENIVQPYLLFDGYDRTKISRNFSAAVLENEYLRATFLVQLGGRLWSLVHKPTNTELLHVNPVFQPTNLAVRNAWFSGGVEWNIGIFGHCPLTCEPLFAARVIGDDGTPILRLYEWERARRVAFALDFSLPPASQFLLVRVRIINAQPHATPMYWWSNIAVDEKEGTRVLVPANDGFCHDYDGRLVARPLPLYNGQDATYPTGRLYAGDQYFNIPPQQRRWITALDKHGRGLIQTSTARLAGRKLFFWGMSNGGRRWQEYLAQKGHNYIEIQAGLTQIQGQFAIMPPGAEWTWLEAYGLMEADPSVIHGSDWPAACGLVDRRLQGMLPAKSLDARLTATSTDANRVPVEILHAGSGWGALELERLVKAGKPPFAPAAMPFPSSTLGPDQQPWLHLLRDGQLPCISHATAPGSLMVQPEWRQLLEVSANSSHGAHWLAWYHLGLMRYRAGDRSGARAAWEHSCKLQDNAWARRQLAISALENKEPAQALELLCAAARLSPHVVPLALECARLMAQQKQWTRLLEFVATLPSAVTANEQLAFMRALAALETGDLDFVGGYLDAFLRESREMIDIREGDGCLANLWFGMHARRRAKELGVPLGEELMKQIQKEYPVPQWIDFRMHVTGR